MSASQEQELEQIGTPAGKLDKKREATSPLDQLPEKKLNRKASTSSQTSEDVMQVDAVADPVAPVHILSEPMYPNDILLIAAQLRTIMLPEIRAAVRDENSEVKSVILNAVQETTGVMREELRELVGCLGFNGPLRQYFSLYRAVS